MRSTPLIATLLSLAAASPAFLRAPSAFAQTGSREQAAADSLFQVAKAAMERGDLASACAQFAESHRIDPAPGTLLNLGECEERQGKVATALAHFKEARATLPPSDFRVAFADSRIAGIQARIPRLTLHVTARDGGAVSVVCDDRDVPRASWGIAVPVDPGSHRCLARAAGHRDAAVEVVVREGETRVVELKVGADTASTAEPRPADAGGGWGFQRVAALVAGGAGAVGLGIGTIFGFVAKGTYDSALTNDCKGAASSCTGPGVSAGQSAHGQAEISTAAFIAGGALIAGGAALYFTAPKTGRVAVAPTVGWTGAGLAVSGSW